MAVCLNLGLLAELRGTEALLTLQSDPTSIIAYPDLQITFTSALSDHDPMIDYVGNKNLSVINLQIKLCPNEAKHSSTFVYDRSQFNMNSKVAC